MRKIDFALTYVPSLDEIAEFLLDQDPVSAPDRMLALETEIEEFKPLVLDRPHLVKAYEPPSSRKKEIREKNQKQKELLDQLNFDSVRENVMEHHSLLYGVSETKITFIAVKHHRQAHYSLTVPEV
ncbi:hypothetical protein AWB81_07376 [Caballeronia arationis]|uniref:hypothetical protein n=1 Tax=Caballeronia arationis TaxID=1777142 RepID=UPI00074CAB7B|nr:hypothetical protein [Caballeronia arationis]SAL05951.1 hypothetical protein AWB81_07376 [Caballeronia arationis]